MDLVPVYSYCWSIPDRRTLTVEQVWSRVKVTRAFFDNRVKNGHRPPYTLHEETMEMVAPTSVVDGIYNPDPPRSGSRW